MVGVSYFKPSFHFGSLSGSNLKSKFGLKLEAKCYHVPLLGPMFLTAYNAANSQKHIARKLTTRLVGDFCFTTKIYKSAQSNEMPPFVSAI